MTWRAPTLLSLLFLAACAPARSPLPPTPPPAPTPTVAPAPAPAPVAASASPTAPAPAAAPPLVFIENDVGAAMKRAKAEHKAVFVDAWAAWCHTCLSMKAYVLTDPSLRPLADRVVFASVDTDRDENAPFLEHHSARVLPSIFLLDPERDAVIGYWPGSASVAELKGFVDDALGTLDAARPEGDPARELALAQRAYAARDAAKAIDAYARAVARSDATWPRRSEALIGWVQALSSARRWAQCVEIGQKYLGEIRGAAIPADYAGDLLRCAYELPPGPARDGARAAAIGRLREFLSEPPADASADDVADAWATLGETLHDLGDVVGARKASEARLAVMEKAALAAPTPEAAATFDYGRAQAYVALGRGEEAVRMLEEREKQVPSSYEAPARLASVLGALGRLPEALIAWERAISKAYGPRKLRYLAQKSAVLGRMGNRREQLATLREEVKGYHSLPAGQGSPALLDDARRRLGNAELAAMKPAAKR